MLDVAGHVGQIPHYKHGRSLKSKPGLCAVDEGGGGRGGGDRAIDWLVVILSFSTRNSVHPLTFLAALKAGRINRKTKNTITVKYLK